jgi:hypothetical protein
MSLALKESEGSRAKAPRGKLYYEYRDPLATPDMESSGFFSVKDYSSPMYASITFGSEATSFGLPDPITSPKSST